MITYSADMGEVHYGAPTTVVIAGRPRPGVVWCYPGIVEAYAFADRVADSVAREREATAAYYEALREREATEAA